MTSRSVLIAVLLISLGIVFGVVLVSNFRGIDNSFAGQEVKLGNQSQQKASASLQSLNDAFHTIAKNVTPSVVYITVKTKGEPDSKDEEGGGPDIFHRFFDPNFHFQNPRRGPEVGAGSGVILTTNGYILTNNHVVDNANSDGIQVTLPDTRQFKGKLIGTDKYTDLAVVKIDASELSVATIGNSDDVEVGNIVFAFGNPLGLTSTMTQGIVSALGRRIDLSSDQYSIENFIQTDAAVNPGNSGGSLVDINGAVIGINTAIATTNARYQGYSFAIPINLAKKVATDIIKFGKVRRGYIGVGIRAVDAVTGKASGLDKAQGVIVEEVKPNSAGSEADMRLGDIILSVDGKEVNSSNALQTIIAGKYPGESVTLKILRDRKEIEKKVALKSRDDEAEVVAAKDSKSSDPSSMDSAPAKTFKFEELGLTVSGLSLKMKKSYDTENGVFVESVEPLGPAQERDLRPGDIILSVGDKQVTSVDEFYATIKKLKPGDAVMLRVKGEDKKVKFRAIEMPK